MIFLRTTPLLPNWFINLSSPIVGISLPYFFVGTFIGLMPMNFIHVNTGKALGDISSFGASAGQMLLLTCLSFAALIPSLLWKNKKIEEQEEIPN